MVSRPLWLKIQEISFMSSLSLSVVLVMASVPTLWNRMLMLRCCNWKRRTLRTSLHFWRHCMGRYDDAEMWELVGSFLFSQLQGLDINLGFYSDDRLAITNITLRDSEDIMKDIYWIFNNSGLQTICEANKRIINFFDISFNLNNSTYPLTQRPTPNYNTYTINDVSVSAIDCIAMIQNFTGVNRVIEMGFIDINNLQTPTIKTDETNYSGRTLCFERKFDLLTV